MKLFKSLTIILKTYYYYHHPHYGGRRHLIYIAHKYSTLSKNNYPIDLRIKNLPLNNFISKLQDEYNVLISSSNKTLADHTLAAKSRLNALRPIVHILEERRKTVENITNLQDLLNDSDIAIKRLAEDELLLFENKIKEIDHDLLESLLILTSFPTAAINTNSIMLEVSSGVGGKEAQLFAKELFDMYCNFIEYKKWQLQIADYSATDLGGIRHASALITGTAAFDWFQHEAGVHRVQRIPSTEKSGRIHTSTVSVVALPQPTDDDLTVNLDSKDLKIETKRASGAGGQHVNTTDSAVRIVHLPTGVAVECQVDRSQVKNRQIAMVKLRTLLYQRQLESQLAQSQETRKSQVRTMFRNEKIRTYNFSQDRVTDHRLQGDGGHHVHNLKGFLLGRGDALEDLIEELEHHRKKEMLFGAVVNDGQ